MVRYAPVEFAELAAPASWHTVDLISDLHLQAEECATVDAFRGYLETTSADALFILGDLFEVWVGDDAAAVPGFEQMAACWLRKAARRLPIYFLCGNRDFLVGPAFAESAGLRVIADPTVLSFQGQRWLLSHGDLLCLADTDYLAFRARVREPEWQAAFLAQPLTERRRLARDIRMQSEARKADPQMLWADVDDAAARAWLQRANARVLIHGHTHRPRDHDLGAGLRRFVLSDWNADTHPPRAQVLCLSPAGAQRVDLR